MPSRQPQLMIVLTRLLPTVSTRHLKPYKMQPIRSQHLQITARDRVLVKRRVLVRGSKDSRDNRQDKARLPARRRTVVVDKTVRGTRRAKANKYTFQARLEQEPAL